MGGRRKGGGGLGVGQRSTRDTHLARRLKGPCLAVEPHGAVVWVSIHAPDKGSGSQSQKTAQLIVKSMSGGHGALPHGTGGKGREERGASGHRHRHRHRDTDTDSETETERHRDSRQQTADSRQQTQTPHSPTLHLLCVDFAQQLVHIHSPHVRQRAAVPLPGQGSVRVGGSTTHHCILVPTGGVVVGAKPSRHQQAKTQPLNEGVAVLGSELKSKRERERERVGECGQDRGGEGIG